MGVGKNSAMVRSMRELEQMKDKGEGREFTRRGGVQATVFPREEKERGVQYRSEGRVLMVPNTDGIRRTRAIVIGVRNVVELDIELRT